jgi:dihydroorotase
VKAPIESSGEGTGVISLAEALDRREGESAGLILREATVLDPVAGLDGVHDVVIRDGAVVELASPGSAADEGGEVVEASGLHAFPAFFDPHVHLRTPGQEHKEDIETGTRAAAAGGYCGVIAMANTEPPVSTAADVEALREAAREGASIPVGFLATVTRGMEGEDLTEMAELADAGALGFSDDGLPIRSAGLLRRALQYQRLCGGTIALHEEDPDLSGKGVMHEGPVSAALGLAGIPSVSESTMIARDAALAGYEGGRIHVQHLSAAESVDAVRAAKAAGVKISCEASPHHLCLTDEEVRSLDPQRFKMNPPLRSEEDRQALIEALRDGTIDCVATDHAPHAAEEKEVPFEQAAMGVTGLETAFAALHTDLVVPGVLELGLIVERLAGGAEPFGLPRPTLAPGSEANVVLCDLSAEWTVGEDGYESRSSNSWCAGRKLTGRVLMTVAGGQVAYRLRSFSMGVAA